MSINFQYKKNKLKTNHKQKLPDLLVYIVSWLTESIEDLYYTIIKPNQLQT